MQRWSLATRGLGTVTEQLLYDELVPWYWLVDPTLDHADEAESYRQALLRGATPKPETLLDLGSGAGNNAFHLKRDFRCTLTDLSDSMLGLSRELNPDCEHFQGDMRTLRLDRSFDAVLVHDSVMYMTTEADLLAVAETAFVHTRPGGACVFAPDVVRETFVEATNLIEGAEGQRALRGIEWSWDPDSSDCTTRVEYVFVLRDGETVRTVHDRHLEGLFSVATWQTLLGRVGFRVELTPRALDDGAFDQVFLCRRP